MSDDEPHPEPAVAPEFGDDEVQHVDYILWSHGADSALRARVKAELRGETPPTWAVADGDGGRE